MQQSSVNSGFITGPDRGEGGEAGAEGKRRTHVVRAAAAPSMAGAHARTGEVGEAPGQEWRQWTQGTKTEEAIASSSGFRFVNRVTHIVEMVNCRGSRLVAFIVC